LLSGEIEQKIIQLFAHGNPTEIYFSLRADGIFDGILSA